MKFKVRDKVKYVSKRFGDSSDNPLWGGKHGKIIGVVREIEKGEEMSMHINWGNGERNSYYEDDLNFVKGGKAKKVSLEVQREKALQEYSTLVESSLTGELRNIDMSIKKRRKNLKVRISALFKKELREKILAEKKDKEALKEIIWNFSRKNIISDLKKIDRHPFISQTKISDGELQITTRSLKVSGESIGKFRIRVPLEDFGNQISISNLTFQANYDGMGYTHWCIRGSSPCWGGWGAGIKSTWKSGELYLMTDNILKFLQKKRANGYLEFETWIDNKERI